MTKTTDTFYVPLTDHGLIRVDGADATAFLHHLCTNDVAGLPPDGVRFGALCNAKGRMLASFLYWREGDAFLLQVSNDLLPALVKKLSLFVLRSQVKITDASAEHSVIGVSGPQAAAAMQALYGGTAAASHPMHWCAVAGGQLLALGDQRYQLVLSRATADSQIQRLPSPLHRAGPDAWRLAEIRAGIPRITLATQEIFIPQMVNYEIVGGVNFKKGCYPGQEIVARTQYLGKIKRRMYRAAIDSSLTPPPAAGVSLFAPETAEQSCGNLVLVAPVPEGGLEALAVIQSTCADGGEVHLGAPDGPHLKRLPLPYNID